MELYDVLLFLHILGVVLLFVAITIETLAGARIRGAEQAADIATWAEFEEKATGPLHGVSTLLLAIPGLWMAAIADLWSAGWVQIGIGVLVLAAGAGIGYITPKIKRIAETAAAEGEGAPSQALRELTMARDLWIIHHAMIGLAMGAIFIMSTKTGMVGSIVAVVVGALVGGVGGMMMTRGRIETPTTTGTA